MKFFINNYSFMTKKNPFFVFILLFFTTILFSQDIDNLNLPENFKISVFADGLDSPRQITETESGYIIVGSKKGDKIYAIKDRNSNGSAEIKILIAEGLQNPTGVAMKNGDLYFSEIDKIWVIKDIDKWLTSNSNVLPEKNIYMDDLPDETWHGFKYLGFGPDGNPVSYTHLRAHET